MSEKKKSNGDQQCKCRTASLFPHRKKKCLLFGKEGLLLSPDAQIQNAIALDKEKDEELDQSPEAIQARIEKAVKEGVPAGTIVKVTVTIETAPPPPPSNEDAGTFADAEPPAPPQPAATPESEAPTSPASPGLTVCTPIGTQYDEHDTYANSPLADTAEDDLLGGFVFVREVSGGDGANSNGDSDDDEEEGEDRDDDKETEDVALGSGADAGASGENADLDSIMAGFESSTSIPADEGDAEESTV